MRDGRIIRQVFISISPVNWSVTWWWIRKIEASWETGEVLGNIQRLLLSEDNWEYADGESQRIFLKRDWLLENMNICRHCVQENRTCLCPWPADHITALARPSLRISGEPPRSVLLGQPCRVRRFLWKSGISPHQNCLEDKWASHLVSTEVIYVGAIFGVGKGNLISLDALAGSLPSVFRCPLAGCGTAHFFDFLHR